MILRFREVDRDKFDAVVDGRKRVETRAATPKYRKIQPDDKLVFVCGPDKVTKTVRSVSIFPGIESLFNKFAISDVLPGIQTIPEAEAVYCGFPGYREKIAQHGLLALELDP